ncbi:TetR/AcrR family transcriptional regulator [Bacteriovoracaceae bacterium]|nr:TetR/AcrR family transcriptional regulator [Bacteriovoracaceae bacterium]
MLDKPLKLKKKEPKQDRAKFLIDTIVEAATRIIKGDVNKDFNTNTIAEVAGVSVGSIYQYYKNKEGIVEDVFHYHLENHFETLMKEKMYGDGITSEQLIEKVIRGQFELWNKNPALAKALLSSVPYFFNVKKITKNVDKTIFFFMEIIKKNNLDIPRENLELKIDLVIGMVRNNIFLFFTNPDKYQYELMVNETINMAQVYIINKNLDTSSL